MKIKKLIESIEKATGKRVILKEKITHNELDNIENFIDNLFKALNIDVIFTTHFYDRLNDTRNINDIEPEELIHLFKNFFVKYKDKINLIPLNKDSILKDLQTKLNLPFIMQYDKTTKEINFVAKTIMRTDKFNSGDKKYFV